LLTALVAIAISAAAQNRTFHGTVLSAADDEPLIGATVTPIGGGHPVPTDVDGRFTITVSASVKEVKVTYVGHNALTVALTNGMVVKLETSSTMLDNVVVTGYGTGKKLGSVVGSVNVVGQQTLEDTPSSNFVDALQGQVPGLNIYSNSGDPSDVPSAIRIRGVNSINASTTPLFILDGAPTTSNIFTTLSPNDIENVTVLKDASATAVYGSRAANGVIVITTKKGKYGDNAQVSVRANIGWSGRADNRVNMMNSQEYIKFRDLINQPVTQDVRDLVDNYGINTNWFDELIKDNALLYSMEGVIQGGSEKVRYYLSLGHYSQDGLVANSGMQRESLRYNVDAKVNDWFKVGMSSTIGYQSYDQNQAADGFYFQNPFAGAYTMLPYDSPYYYSFNDNGDIVYGDRAKYYKYSEAVDPNYYSEISLKGKRSRLTANMNLYEQINPVKGLTLRAQQSVTGYDSRSTTIRPQLDYIELPEGYIPGQNKVTLNLTGRTGESFTRYYSFTYTNTAEYNFLVNNNHDFTFLVGQEAIISKSNGFGVATTGQPNATQWLLTNGNAVTLNDVAQSISRTVMNSYFATMSYSYDNRYFLDASFRRDGSSKFAPGHRWGSFWSVGAMWNAKNESFLQPYTWLSALKVRANYGTVGNSGIDPYQYDGIVGTGRVYNGQGSLGISTQSNHDLTWETVEQFNFGFDAGFWNRLNLSADFYLKNTKNMLLDIPYSITTGFSSGSANIGSMRNVGVDVEASYDIVRSKDWHVGVRANFNYNKNTITELFNGKEEYVLAEYGMVYRVGENPFQLNSVRYAGVDPRDGQQMWYDINGNLTKTYNKERDAVNTGKSFVAPWAGGFGIDARWKGLSLRADFTWSADKYINNWTNQVICSAAQSLNGYNQRVEMLNVWTKPGDVTDIPNLLDLYGNVQTTQADDRYIENCSFVRMKNLTVAYTLPRSILNAIRLKDLTFHFTGRNLLTFTGYTGTDPEYENNGVRFFYPNTRQYEFGLEVTF
ncbi:MAG: TonB-dependent receptor, partial [Paramuribaculum sp.]|nr:TonB-dependent receptor [Paramuribaculum sp.]MDE6487756.1 TonB-dependent receptor [Paramuribaculum sp.]